MNSRKNASRRKPLIGLACRFSEDERWHSLPIEYSQAVVAAGGIPVLIPLVPETAAELASRLDAIVLCGSASDVDPVRYGEGRHPGVKTIHRDRDETDFLILDAVFRNKKPLLGICYGLQSLNVFLQGTLIQHIPEYVPGSIEHQDSQARHPIAIEPGTRLAEWTEGSSEIVVNSTHHQSIQKPGTGLRVAARAFDGIIEAAEGEFPDHFVVGVQWHPERIRKQETLSRRLFSELVHAARPQHQGGSEDALSRREPVVKPL